MRGGVVFNSWASGMCTITAIQTLARGEVWWALIVAVIAVLNITAALALSGGSPTKGGSNGTRDV